MAKVALSPKASVAAGALFAYLGPRLAQDAKIDLKQVLAPMKGGKSFSESKAAIAAAVRAVVKGKLAQDADIDDVANLLDAVEAVVGAPEEAVPEGLGEANGEMPLPEMPGEEAKDDDPMALLSAKIRDLIAGHVGEDVLAQFDQLVASGAKPAAPEAPEVPAAPAASTQEKEDDEMSKDRKGMDRAGYVTKTAMDEAIRKAQADAAANHRAIRDAERVVRPYVGELAIACDSADDVYRHALKMLGVKVDGIHPSAFRTILEMQPKAGQRQQQHQRIAADSAAAKSFTERHPAAQRIARM